MESNILAAELETLNIDDSPAASPPWTELPSDLTANILQRLDVLDRLGCAQLVCTAWWKACRNPAMWRVVNLMNFYRCNDDCDILCRRAVDLSQGQLISLTIGFFIDVELLNYIADGSPQLRCLAFPSSDGNISASAWVGAIAKLPNIKELHFLSAKLIPPGDTEAVRIFWPLNSFKLDVCRAHSVGSAKCWPDLDQIELVYTDVDYNGLEAKCAPLPPLESIHLRRFWVDHLGGESGKKWHTRENHFKFDSFDVLEEMRLMLYGTPPFGL